METAVDMMLLAIQVQVPTYTNRDKARFKLYEFNLGQLRVLPEKGRLVAPRFHPPLTDEHSARGDLFHLQLVERAGAEWQNHLLIKHYYLQHPETTQQYAELKKDLAQKFPNDRRSYGAGKDAFIMSVIARAKLAMQPSGFA